MTEEDFKTCTKCGAVLPLECFPLSGGGRRRRDCKACHTAQIRAIYYANLDESRRINNERQRQYYAEDPERVKARTYAARNANRDHLNRNIKWAAENPEKVREYKRKWAKANPEAERDKVRRRRARRLDAFVADAPFDEILIRDRGVCGICGEQIMDNFSEIDHVIPLAAGGTHEPDNVQLAHRSCNRRKAAKIAA